MIRSIRAVLLAGFACLLAIPLFAQSRAALRNESLWLEVSPATGSYALGTANAAAPVLQSRIGAEINHRWVRSSDYPHHELSRSRFEDLLGSGRALTLTFTGLDAEPDLICDLRLYDSLPLGSVQVSVRNSGTNPVTIQAIRSVDAFGSDLVRLGGPDSADRVLSDSFSENLPTMRIYDLAAAPGGEHLAVGSQLIYNRQSKQSLFFGAVTARKFPVLFELRVAGATSRNPSIASYTADSTGTTAVIKHRRFGGLPPASQVELSLPVAPGQGLASERLVFSAGTNYHAQLGAYGRAVRILRHARVPGERLMGWWSWTAYYAGLSEGTALTNAQWLHDHLENLGYNFFHIDEGYQYARGEYTTADAALFPHGMAPVGRALCRLGLKFAIWTAPFEVSERAWVYQHHKDWLVHRSNGDPIEIATRPERIYALDTTNPGAQEYLRETYRTLTRVWGVRYIKLDFMDATAIEGYRYRPNTTAYEAQRIGLEVIRKAVGDDVLLDKDGSPMLGPVGIVDEGRVSVDTGHSFRASRSAATGIAARFYMDGNFFISDPDAFTVSRQLIPDQDWHQGKTPLTLNEAQVSITLAALAGGMFEIGDDLPTLGSEPRRLALVENRDLIDMSQLGRAAIPLDLMTYRDADRQPSVFFLREDRRRAMLAVFNWTEAPQSHAFSLASLGLSAADAWRAYDVLNGENEVPLGLGEVQLPNQPSHSVRLLKLIDMSVPPAAPSVAVEVSGPRLAGSPIQFSAMTRPESVPALGDHWDFGDGTAAAGGRVNHSYTRAGNYQVHLEVSGLDGLAAQRVIPLTVTGIIKTQFDYRRSRRYVPPDDAEQR